MMLKTCKNCNKNKDLNNFSYLKKAKSYRNVCKSCRSKRDMKVRDASPARKYKQAKYNAKKRNINFDLSLSEFKSFYKKPCHYCGAKIETVRLDRIDNDLGYHLENVVSCCYTCNSFKHVFDVDSFLEHVKKIYRYQQKVNNDK